MKGKGERVNAVESMKSRKEGSRKAWEGRTEGEKHGMK